MAFTTADRTPSELSAQLKAAGLSAADAASIIAFLNPGADGLIPVETATTAGNPVPEVLAPDGDRPQVLDLQSAVNTACDRTSVSDNRIAGGGEVAGSSPGAASLNRVDGRVTCDGGVGGRGSRFRLFGWLWSPGSARCGLTPSLPRPQSCRGTSRSSGSPGRSLRPRRSWRSGFCSAG
jgi:hypothetical protein